MESQINIHGYPYDVQLMKWLQSSSLIIPDLSSKKQQAKCHSWCSEPAGFDNAARTAWYDCSILSKIEYANRS
ncbi:MAG: hypothetical protein ACLFQA_10275 [Bacteroidales bacterium]